MQNESPKFKIIDKNLLKVAAETICKGGVIICPTDTVYGFLADATNKRAVEKIFKIKKRLKTKPLAVFVKDIKMAKKLAEINKKQEKILTLRLRSGQAKYWPGKFTFVLGVRPGSDPGLTPLAVKKKTVALRIPKYKFLNNLLKEINRPLAQTSVNISGQSALTKIGEVLKQFHFVNPCLETSDRLFREQVDLIIDAGDLPKSKPSKIIDLTENKFKVLRK